MNDMHRMQVCHHSGTMPWQPPDGSQTSPGATRPACQPAPHPPRNQSMVIGIAIGSVVLSMVVVTGILASVGLPAYQAYTRRTLVSAAIMNADGIMRAMEGFHAQKGHFPGTPEEMGVDPDMPLPRAVASMRVVPATHSIAITFDQEVQDGAQVLLTPAPEADTGSITWSCTASGSLPKAYIPGDCH